MRTEADTWERERPQRETKAAADVAEIERLERSNKDMREAAEAAQTRSAKIEELKSAAAELEQSRLKRLEYEKQAPARAEAAAKAEAAKMAVAEAEKEALRKPLSCENLLDRFKSVGTGLDSTRMDLANASLMGDKTSVCKISRSLIDTFEPMHRMAIECKNIEIGYNLNIALSGFRDLLRDQGC